MWYKWVIFLKLEVSKMHLVLVSVKMTSTNSQKFYYTLKEKVTAYEDFLKSNDRVLVVIGNGGTGKSIALDNAKKTDELIVFEENYPQIYHTDEASSPGLRRVIYHLFEDEEDLAQGLKRKYGARIVRFKRGEE